MVPQDPVGPGYFMFALVGIMCLIVIIDAIRDVKKNKNKKTKSKSGDLPYLKFGCDDITAVVAFFTFIDELEDNYISKY